MRESLFVPELNQSAIRNTMVDLNQSQDTRIKSRIMSIRRSVVIVCLILNFVPIKFYLCQNQQLAKKQIISSSRQTNMKEHFDWARRLDKPTINQQIKPIVRRNDLQALTSGELQMIQEGEEVEQQPEAQLLFQQPKQQSFISDYVTNQGHRLLKNLVNNTFMDLIARQPSLTKTNQLLQSLPVMVSNQQERLPRYTSLPAIGRLYSFLFPANQQPFIPGSTMGPLIGSNSSPGEVIQSSSSDLSDTYDYGSPMRENYNPLGGRRIVSLSAPYDLRPRLTSILGTLTKQSAIGTNGFDLTPNESGSSKWRRHKPTDESNHTLNGRQNEPTSDIASLDEDDSNRHNYIEEVNSNTNGSQLYDEDQQQSKIHPNNLINNNHKEFKLIDDNSTDNSIVFESNHQSSDIIEPLTEISGETNSIGQQQMTDNSGSDDQMETLLIANDTMSSNTTTSGSEQTHDDTEFLAAQLPSTYNSAIRIPPEGYYDDYYKWASDTNVSGSSFVPSPSTLESYVPSESYPPNDGYNQQPMYPSSGMFLANHNLDNNSNLSNNHQPSASSSKQSSAILDNNQLDQFYLSQHQSMDQLNEPPSTDDSFRFVTSNITNLEPIQHKQTIDNTLNDKTNQEQDNIQIIIANTNSSSFDAKNNEKIINYISEGQNVTFKPTGKSPRQTFINKDLNELPSSLPENNTSNNYKDHMNLYQDIPTTSSSHLDTTMSPIILKSSEYEEENSDKKKQIDGSTTPTGDRLYHEDNSSRYDQDDHHDEAALRRLSSESKRYGGYNRIDKPKNQMNRPAIGQQLQQKQQRADKVTRKDRRSNKSTKNRQHQAIKGPQVTQAQFDLKDIILSKPTEQPSMTESAVETLNEIPTKIKKLRDSPPDKNELMNELLTALDRVKVAIYKLQPLTAKMNAIYRKSITSNTRDTVLENHKGTYAKRYPPGDYDDTYDRIHPSEVLYGNRASSERKGRRTRRGLNSKDDILGEESNPSATYLPAPGFADNGTADGLTLNYSLTTTPIDMDSSADSNRIVATGIGRRLGDGRVRGEVHFGLEDQTGSLDDQDLIKRVESLDNEATTKQNDSSSEPTFGYRITIYQSPENEDDDGTGSMDDNSANASDRLSYLLEDDTARVANNKGTIGEGEEEEDLLDTSESSLVESASVKPILSTNGSDYGGSTSGEEILEEGESMEKKKKMENWKKKKEEEKKKEAKEKEGKKKEKSKKSEERKKKDAEERKRKKEYKKVKHNKGLTSKESKKMHRDKHIKAHDRGAAKEKALKERTQIEFFEREQIVDDEYEKGKKSTIKAGWQSGQESKKSNKDIGDSMSMGGSHFVAHELPYQEKAHGSSAESSSAKKSNKFEKKNLESKGKKFKGWREKGYKIITETEFIDRGSLHDSAYKKRDKGAAHQQKYKKQEASSEGHHGSMQEHHMKSHKKEEKKEKMHEKKEKHMKKGEEELKKGKKKDHGEKKKMVEKKGKGDEDADGEESMLAATIRPSSDKQIELMNRNQRSMQPIISKDENYWHIRSVRQQGDDQPIRPSAALMRLINLEHDSEIPADRLTTARQEDATTALKSSNSTKNDNQIGRDKSNHYHQQRELDHIHTDELNQNASRRSDNSNPMRDYNGNSSILDIVDNLTGQKVNKTQVGTYELDDQRSGNYATSGSKVANDRLVTKVLNGPKQEVSYSTMRKTETPTYPSLSPSKTTTTTTLRPKQQHYTSSSDSELGKLVSLLNQGKKNIRNEAKVDKLSDLNLSTLNKANSNAFGTSNIALANRLILNDLSSPGLGMISPQTGEIDLAAQNLLKQLTQRAAAAATTRKNNPSDQLMDLSSLTMANNGPRQQFTQFLPSTSLFHNQQQTPPIFSHSTNNHHFDYGSTALSQNNGLFPNEQLLDYDPDILSPSAHNFSIE